MATHHVILPGDLTPRALPKRPGQIMVFGPGEVGHAGIGHATYTKSDGQLVVTFDDAVFKDRCRTGETYGHHSHRLEVTHGSTPFARAIVTTKRQLVAIELTGHDDGRVHQLRPGARPTPTPIPPRPRTILDEL